MYLNSPHEAVSHFHADVPPSGASRLSRGMENVGGGLSRIGGGAGAVVALRDGDKVEFVRNAYDVTGVAGSGLVHIGADMAKVYEYTQKGSVAKALEYSSNSIAKGASCIAGALEAGMKGCDTGVGLAGTAIDGGNFITGLAVDKYFARKEAEILERADTDIPAHRAKLQEQRRKFEQLKQQRESQAASERASRSYTPSSGESGGSSGFEILGAVVNSITTYNPKPTSLVNPTVGTMPDPAYDPRALSAQYNNGRSLSDLYSAGGGNGTFGTPPQSADNRTRLSPSSSGQSGSGPRPCTKIGGRCG